MNGDVLSKLYNLNMMTIEMNLKDVTHEESLTQPQAAGNCLNWVLGHIVATRNSLMKLIGDNPLWTEQETDRYRRGSQPLLDGEMALPLSKMLTDLKTSQDKLLDRLQKMSPEELESPLEEGTKYEQLAVLQFHEAYHAGQLGLLRRLIGKPGAIT